MRTKKTTLALGTISEGTLRPEDLIPAYLDALSSIRLSKAERMFVRQASRDWDHAECNYDGPGTFADDDLPQLLDDLLPILESHCPDYAYFGSLEGDGACFGVWANIDGLEEDARNGKVIKDEWQPASGEGSRFHGRQSHWMQVSDHGNVTLYRRSGHRWIEVWSVV